jgi:2-polyprenyl-3-methyl-5-hydroxy-6-metoxy-1,4-benzoquinol methylase
MKNPDFEVYADLKKFNSNIASTWSNAFSIALQYASKSERDVQLLDYGCGDGKYFFHWLDRGLSAENIHGLEVSKKRIERCRQLGWKNVHQLVQGQSLPYESGSFDVVNCMEVIEHIPEAEGKRVIAELRRVINPKDGVLMISTPNYPVKRFYDFYDAIVTRRWARVYDDPTHITFFNHQRLTRLLGSHFTRVEPHPFKPGFLYKYIRHPALLHKLFFLCRP